MSSQLSVCSVRHCIPQLPDPLRPYLILLDEPAGLPICRACQAAVLPKSLPDHLRKHHQLPVELRGMLRTLIAALPSPSLDFDNVPAKPDGSAPLEALHVVNAFHCKQCHFIRRDLTDVRKHINQEHHTSAAGSYDQILAQSWFGGRRAIYWSVSKPCTRRDEPPCVWGFYGKGFGDKRPRVWDKEKVAESLPPDH